MLGSHTDLHIFDAGSINGTRYCNEILFLPYVRLFRGAMGMQFFHGRQCTMSSHSSCRTALRERVILNVWIGRHDFRSQSYRACMDFSRLTLGSSYLTTSNDSGASIGAARRMGSKCLNNSLTPSFSAWADAVKPA
ncbi:hypothetical protein TNCV_1898591 [Trichonephila clavipes]|nr:hypothetical protein TNCV_1898591 [Trichonephila clavipes]